MYSLRAHPWLPLGMLKDEEVARDQILPSVNRLQEAATQIAATLLQRTIKGSIGDSDGGRSLPANTYECLVQQTAQEGALLPQGGGSTGTIAQTRYCVRAVQWRPTFK